MSKIVRLTHIESIKPGVPPDIMPDGTIVNPVRYSAVDVEFDDGMTVQIERPLTMQKIRAARLAISDIESVTIDGFALGDAIPPGP